jgi:hypothetical protein
MSVVDEELSQTISQVFNSFSQCLGAIGAVAGATKGTFLILIVPLMVFYTNIQGRYIFIISFMIIIILTKNYYCRLL